MNDMQVFVNEKFGDLRMINRNGELWFVAADVCQALEIANPTDAIKRLDKDERARFNLGRQGETNIVNEPGLYTLILGSRKPEAKAFKRWVTHEVLPSIRKTGVYVAPEADTAAVLTAALKKAQEENRRLQELLTMKEKGSPWFDLPPRKMLPSVEHTMWFARTLREMLDEGQVKVIPLNDEVPEEWDAPTVGWYDDLYLYLVPRTVAREIYHAKGAEAECLWYNRRLYQSLKNVGLVMEGSDGRTTRMKRIGSRSFRLLWVDRERLDRLTGKDDEE